jgi:hypothetical protein
MSVSQAELATAERVLMEQGAISMPFAEKEPEGNPRAGVAVGIGEISQLQHLRKHSSLFPGEW